MKQPVNACQDQIRCAASAQKQICLMHYLRQKHVLPFNKLHKVQHSCK